MKSNSIRKSVFLESLEYVYSRDSTDYLITLRDGLSIIISQRINGGHKPYKEHYKGVVRI